MDFDWKSLVRTAAPILGTAISGGNPLAGMALQAVANAVVGRPDATEAQIASVLKTSDPTMLLKLKQADNDFDKHLATVGLDAKKLILEDKDSARNREIKTKDDTPRKLLYVLSLMVVAIICLISFVDLEQAKLNMLLPITGAIMTAWIGAVQYFVGTTLSSSQKNQWKIK